MSSCVSVVIDCDARHWGELVEKNDDEGVIGTMIDAIASYTTAHMSMNGNNRFVIIAVDKSVKKPTIYASHASKKVDRTFTVRRAIRETLKKSALLTDASDPAVFAPAIAVALCHICRFKNEGDGREGRVLIINIGSDLIGEHNILMNIFFAAHKHNILIDVANIGESTPILQQASDITGGTYFNVLKPRQLLQYTMCFALCRASLRPTFPSSSATSVDYRASCHCHGTPVSIGWVCSVCLAVQCRFAPFCPACNLFWPTMGFSIVFQRLAATTGVCVIFAGIGLGAYKLRQSSDSLRGRGIYWRSQEMEDFLYCKEENLKRKAAIETSMSSSSSSSSSSAI